MTIRFELKAATDDLHRELDDRLSRLDLADAADYRTFVSFHARTIPPFEDSLAAAGANALIEGWEEGRRSAAIERDLAALGEAMPPRVEVPSLRGISELLGTAYVIEGSRLGGRMLSRRVGSGLPGDFLSHSNDKAIWLHVIAALDRFLYSDPLIAEARDAARGCFALFLNVAREAGI